MFRQVNERACVSLEKGTEKVPDDNRYHVYDSGKLVASFCSFKKAQELYRNLVRQKNLPPLQKQAHPMSMEEMLTADWALRSNKALLGSTSDPPKGKKSGRFHKVR